MYKVARVKAPKRSGRQRVHEMIVDRDEVVAYWRTVIRFGQRRTKGK